MRGVIFYRLGNSRNWNLYTSNIYLEPGTELTAIATRLGYRDSPESNFRLASP